MSKAVVTAKMLRAADACSEQVERFEQEWPDGAQVTIKNAVRAIELGLSVLWFAVVYLDRPQYTTFYETVYGAWYGRVDGRISQSQYVKFIARALIAGVKRQGGIKENKTL